MATTQPDTVSLAGLGEAERGLVTELLKWLRARDAPLNVDGISEHHEVAFSGLRELFDKSLYAMGCVIAYRRGYARRSKSKPSAW
jgi:hypothetical protein